MSEDREALVQRRRLPGTPSLQTPPQATFARAIKVQRLCPFRQAAQAEKMTMFDHLKFCIPIYLRRLKFWKSHNMKWRDGTVFMSRYTFIKRRIGSIKIHRFRRGDEFLHDHPFHFITIILWRGYIEETPKGKRRVWPGMILFRRATHIHRVIVDKGKDAWTLCITSGHVRDWGFWIDGVWIQHEEHEKRTGRSKETK